MAHGMVFWRIRRLCAEFLSSVPSPARVPHSRAIFLYLLSDCLVRRVLIEVNAVLKKMARQDVDKPVSGESAGTRLFKSHDGPILVTIAMCDCADQPVPPDIATRKRHADCMAGNEREISVFQAQHCALARRQIADCAQWASGTSLRHQPRLGRMALPNG